MHALVPANVACQNPAQFREPHKGGRLSHGARTEQLDEAGVDVDDGVVGLGGIRDERRLRRGRQRLVAQVHRLRRRLARRNVRNYTHLREQFPLTEHIRMLSTSIRAEEGAAQEISEKLARLHHRDSE